MSATATTRPLAKLIGTINSYLICTPEQSMVLALWIVHTHLVHVHEQTPYLLITSPERRCGKTTLMLLLEELVPRPWSCITPSEATVYRKISSTLPTLLLDEVDAIFAPKTAQYHEGLRAVLNGGNRKGATVPRCVGTGMVVHDFNVFCAKAIAGIGTVPDTITDRSVPIRLKRRTREEPVTRFRLRDVRAITEPMRESIAAWAAANDEAMAEARPELPEELNDRAQDACEPLLAIADALGYGDDARAALVALYAERHDSAEGAQVKLLRDIKTIFNGMQSSGLHTDQLVMQLHGMVDSPWTDWYGRGIAARDVAGMLEPYEIESRNVRNGEVVRKGYHRDDFYDAWSRYVTEEEAEEGVTS